MERFYVFPNTKKDADLSVTRRLCHLLLESGASVWAPAACAPALSAGVGAVENGQLPEGIEAILSVGGDGTVLEASRLAIRHGIPLLGINLGRRGYLAEVEPDDLGAVLALRRGAHTTRELMTLSVTLIRGGREWPMPRKTVNEVVLHRSVNQPAVSLRLSVEGESEIHYLADGLILATPCGSTAYSLSAGGPVLSPTIRAVCATPICPHSFFNRAILFDADRPILIRNASSDIPVTVTLDGRENIEMESGDAVRIERSVTPLQILSISDETRDFLGVLHKKMKMME